MILIISPCRHVCAAQTVLHLFQQAAGEVMPLQAEAVDPKHIHQVVNSRAPVFISDVRSHVTEEYFCGDSLVFLSTNNEHNY